MIQSIAGELAGGALSDRRPFRAPHHSASMAALVGGGLKVRPGEVSMAHNGVLFLDELPEFAPAVLDSLRQPLESGETVIARANARVTFPCALPAGRGDEPVQMRAGRHARPYLPARRGLRARLSGARLGTVSRPHRSARRRAGGIGRRHDRAGRGRSLRRRWRRGCARPATCSASAIWRRGGPTSSPMPARRRR